MAMFRIITVTRVSILQNLPEFLLYQNDPVKTVATFYPKLGGGTNSNRFVIYFSVREWENEKNRQLKFRGDGRSSDG